MPRLLRIVPIEATVIPLPTELTTPPVTNMYFDIRENQAMTQRCLKDNITLEQRKEMSLGVFSIIGNNMPFVKFLAQDGSIRMILLVFAAFHNSLYKYSEKDGSGDGDYYLKVDEVLQYGRYYRDDDEQENDDQDEDQYILKQAFFQHKSDSELSRV